MTNKFLATQHTLLMIHHHLTGSTCSYIHLKDSLQIHSTIENSCLIYQSGVFFEQRCMGMWNGVSPLAVTKWKRWIVLQQDSSPHVRTSTSTNRQQYDQHKGLNYASTTLIMIMMIIEPDHMFQKGASMTSQRKITTSLRDVWFVHSWMT